MTISSTPLITSHFKFLSAVYSPENTVYKTIPTSQIYLFVTRIIHSINILIDLINIV